MKEMGTLNMKAAEAAVWYRMRWGWGGERTRGSTAIVLSLRYMRRLPLAYGKEGAAALEHGEQ